MVFYICGEGEWEYKGSKKYELATVLPGGNHKPISQLLVTEGRKMVGV
jgi:hypothetical protein